VTGFEGPSTGIGGPPDTGSGLTAGSRLGWAAALLVLALAAGGLVFALGNESGFAAFSGRRAVAETGHCTGVRARTCDAVVTAPDGSLIKAGATLAGFTRVSTGDVLHVRYRAGRAVPDTLPERALQLSFLVFFAGGAVAALLGVVSLLAGRAGHIAAMAAAVPVLAIPLVVLSLIGTVVAGPPRIPVAGATQRTGTGPVKVRVGGRAVPDIYAEVAARPDRTLVAQGMRYEIVSNRPFSREGCFGAAGCLAGASADWRVNGTDLVATSHLLVFKTLDQAARVKDAVQRDRALANAPAPPPGAVVVGIGGGHYAAAISMSRTDGTPATADPAIQPAMRGLGYFNIDLAVAEELRSPRK
jgi:hypothetical protein